MKVYAISDLHLSINNPKPMDIFGGAWDNYVSEFTADWRARVKQEDTVLIAGDISWAMQLEAARPDLAFLGELPGKKVILRGNHDYWWKSISAVRGLLNRDTFAVQNDCVRIGKLLVCGSRGWTTPENKKFTEEDQKIYDREVIRMTLSLEAMQKMRQKDDRVAVMMHYPPFNSRFEATPFTDLFARFAPDAVIYGHLHGSTGRICLRREESNVAYYLTSCDLIRNCLVEITELFTTNE